MPFQFKLNYIKSNVSTVMFGQFQEQSTHLLLLSWYLHRLVVIRN